MIRFFDLAQPGYSSNLHAPKEDGDEGSANDSDNKEDDKAEDPEEDDEQEDDKEDEDDEDDEKEKDDLPELEVKQAKSLYKLLKDPNVNVKVIEALADKVGMKLTAGENKKEDKKEAKKLADRLVDELGEKYSWLAGPLGKAIEAYFEDQKQQFSGEINNLKNENQQTVADRVLDKLAVETKGVSRKFETKMAQLANELTPAAGVSTEKYIRHLYSIVSSQSGASNVKQQLTDRINRNRNDAESRLRSTGGGGKGVKALPKNASLTEIVEHAWETTHGEGKKK